MNFRPTALAVLALLAGATLAQAQQAVPGVESLIDSLDPDSPRTRGIRVPGAPPPAVPDLTTTTAPPGAAAVSLTVTFATGSATLSPAAMQVLDNLGQALGSARLAGYRFRVEGHTDTVGPEAMNQALSERRAAAVRDFLMQRHGVAAQRIEAAGLGEAQLLVPTPDEVAEPRNRRVQVVNIGG
ncbi:OmpA family protein [Falsiroseomonas sp. HC035]|uniref:OmpA family protein n=1 Tax=Falsiroseomonas sp. HC035 TaxID=3390999 RepID=UPI003D310B0D